MAKDIKYGVDARKAMEAGAGKYLNFISIVLKKQQFLVNVI